MVSIHGSWLEYTGGISPFVVELCGEKIIMFQGGSWILRDSVPIPAGFFVCIFCIFGMNLDNSQNNEPCAAYGFLRGNASCDEKQFYSIFPIFSATECYGASGNVRLWGRLWFDFPARDLNKILGTVPRQVGVGFVAREVSEEGRREGSGQEMLRVKVPKRFRTRSHAKGTVQ